MASNSTSGPAYFVADDLPCVSCGEWVDFEFTEEAHLQLMGALVRRLVSVRAGRVPDEGPLRIIDVNNRWKTRPAPEVMAEIKAAVAGHPQDVALRMAVQQAAFATGRA